MKDTQMKSKPSYVQGKSLLMCIKLLVVKVSNPSDVVSSGFW